MRFELGLLAGCGILMLVACSGKEPPEPAGPVTATTPLAEVETAEVKTGTQGVKPSKEAATTEPVMEGNTGVAVGQKAPSFQLKDQTGTERSLEEFLKQGKVALVFYRSADW